MSHQSNPFTTGMIQPREDNNPNNLSKTAFIVDHPPAQGYVWVVRGNKIFQRRLQAPKTTTRWTPVTNLAPTFPETPKQERTDWNSVFRPQFPELGEDFDWNFMMDLADYYCEKEVGTWEQVWIWKETVCLFVLCFEDKVRKHYF